MDVLGFHLERGPATDRRAVDRIAVRCGPDARFLAAGVTVLPAERVEERGIGRVDDIADHVADAFAIGI
jgi:hypothetical protein